MSGTRSILDGIKVLDVGTFVFGPAATTVMSDFGAEVIKVENPAGGDPYRYLHTLPGMPECDVDYCFYMDGRNKRSVALDLNLEPGREVLYRMVSDADVFVTNMHPSVVEKLQISWSELRPLNERLIYAHATGYGEVGEETEKPGFDATAWWARSGLMDAVRPDGGEPAMAMPAMGDRPSSLSLFGGIMLALYQRQQTGTGTKVSSSLMANGAWANACLIQAMQCGAQDFDLLSRLETPNATVNHYPTADGRWIFLVLISEDRDWHGLTEALARPDLRDDLRFATTEKRREHSHELASALNEIFRSRPLAEWRRRLDEQDVTFGIVATTEEVPADRQMRENGVFVEVADDERSTVDSPIWLEGAAKVSPRRPPAVGEHTEEVLGELGYDAEAQRRLRDGGVIP